MTEPRKNLHGDEDEEDKKKDGKSKTKKSAEVIDFKYLEQK